MINDLTKARFWHKVARPVGQCWPWLGSLHTQGYGRMRVNGKHELAHRVAWEITNGPLEHDQEVIQTCSNRTCCNPAHLLARQDKSKVGGMLRRQLEAIDAKITALLAERAAITAQIEKVTR
jgi:D-hexose-6-phosphate mutarotase